MSRAVNFIVRIIETGSKKPVPGHTFLEPRQVVFLRWSFPVTVLHFFVAGFASVDGFMAIGLMKKKKFLPFNSPFSGVEEKVL